MVSQLQFLGYPRSRALFRELKSDWTLAPVEGRTGIHMGERFFPARWYTHYVCVLHQVGISTRRACERCAIGVRSGAVIFTIEFVYGNSIDPCVSTRHEGVVPSTTELCWET